MAILGPTASGKTDVAIEVASRLGGEVVSVDSMQVYREMDVGTAKPNLIERRGVVHHMIDLVDPAEEYTVAEFAATGRSVIDEAVAPMVVSGGSGLHFRALVDPMSFAPSEAGLRFELEAEDPDLLVERLLSADPEAGSYVDLANNRRVVRAVEVLILTGETPSERARAAEAEDLRRYVPRTEFTAFGIDPGDELEVRVDRRLQSMVAGGLVDEVSGLWKRMSRTARSAVGYRQIGEHLEGHRTLPDAIAEAGRATKRLARRQRTWFQRDPRIRWIPWSDDPIRLARRILESL